MPESVASGDIPDPTTPSPTARGNFDGDDWNKIGKDDDNVSCLSCLLEPIVMEFESTANVVNSTALASLSNVKVKITVWNLLERPGLEVSATLYIKTSDSQRMRFTVIGDIPPGDWPLLRLKATMDAPADLDLMGESHSFHLNTASGQIIYQTGQEEGNSDQQTVQNKRRLQIYRRAQCGLRLLNGQKGMRDTQIIVECIPGNISTVALEEQLVAVAGTLDLLNSGTDWILRGVSQVESIESVIGNLFQQSRQAVQDQKVSEYLPKSRLSTSIELDVATISANRLELGFGKDESYNQTVIKGLTIRLKIQYKQENEMGKVLSSMIGDMEPGVNSETIFLLHSPIFSPHQSESP